MVPINKTIQAATTDAGGMKILDIATRNEAIEVMKLKSYLHLNDDCTKAGYIKDILINKQIKKSTPSDKVMANTFL